MLKSLVTFCKSTQLLQFSLSMGLAPAKGAFMPKKSLRFNEENFPHSKCHNIAMYHFVSQFCTDNECSNEPLKFICPLVCIRN